MSHVDTLDFVVVGSGFGGSVSALRLSEKGYSVRVLEQGKEFAPADFPKTNWNIRRWLWWPGINFLGPFKMTFFRHLTVYSGVGVGGGSLVYGNTLPIPKDGFFLAPSWSHLAAWKRELAPYYVLAKKMLGSATNPKFTSADFIMQNIARAIGCGDQFAPTDVAVYFGTPGQVAPDPYFGGEGPMRRGCTFCGACMTGCRNDAKNTLDKNYLFLARKKGATIEANSKVVHISAKPEGGYRLTVKKRTGWLKYQQYFIDSKSVVLSAGVLGTVDLLLKMQKAVGGLPNLSPHLGKFIRTNSESIIAVTTGEKKYDFSQGIAISSIIHTDEHSHIEPVRYGRGSGFFRLLVAPHAPGTTIMRRLSALIKGFCQAPWQRLKAIATTDFSKNTQILLYMRSLDGTLSFTRQRRFWLSWGKSMGSNLDQTGQKPRAFMPEATALAARFAKHVNGVLSNVFLETLFGTASTAHILGGCCMGQNSAEGVIDERHRVFGYDGLYVIDGSAVSANPGVNPSLTITAMAERAMSFIPSKQRSTC